MVVMVDGIPWVRGRNFELNTQRRDLNGK